VAPPRPLAPPAPPRPATPQEAPQGNAESILVVEDSDDVLALAQETLEALGYRVVVARNADDALRVLDGTGDSGFDLLFTDILMPGSMNGLALAERVRQRMPEIAVLLTTGYNEDLVAEGPGTSSWDVLGKPYRRTALADRVRAALNRRAGTPAAPQPPCDQGYGPRHEA
jgi:CheY-like chemotaxis protein